MSQLNNAKAMEVLFVSSFDPSWLPGEVLSSSGTTLLTLLLTELRTQNDLLRLRSQFFGDDLETKKFGQIEFYIRHDVFPPSF